MQDYKLISKKGEGTFSEVLKAQSVKTGTYYAIKCMKTHFSSQDEVNELREIQALRKLSPHPHIIKLHEVLYDEPTGRLALVFELMEMNMYELIRDRKTPLQHAKVRNYMFQLFKAIDHMHKKGIFHRDIKPENVLLLGDTIKLADLGSCRGTYSSHPYTEYISTRWYRPPECLMTEGYYDHKMDIWGAGCVMYEILTLVPLFPGNNELDMIHRIHNILGTPPQKVLDKLKRHGTSIDFNFPERAGSGFEKALSHVPRECIDLLRLLLTYDADERITADQALKHEYFRDLLEADRQKEFQSSLTSVRLSTRTRPFNHSTTLDHDRSVPSIFSESEKSGHNVQSLKALIVKKPKKEKSMGQAKMLPFLNLSLKVEGIFKHSPNPNDTSTDDEGKKESVLPPIKLQNSMIHMDNKGYLGGGGNLHASLVRKKEEPKRFASTILKPTLSKQILFKKAKKVAMVYRSPDFNSIGIKLG